MAPLRSALLLLCAASLSASCKSDDGGSTAPPALSCLDVLSCASACTTTVCEDSCTQRASAVARQQLQVLLGCVTREACDTTDSDCIQTKCAAEVAGCTGTTQGTLSCDEVLVCAAACNSEDCLTGCVVQGTGEALTELGALVDCNNSAGCDSDSSCLQSACGAEVTSCVGDFPDGGTIEVPPFVPMDNPDMGGGGGGGDDAGTGDTLPLRYVGTVHEHSEQGGVVRDLVAQVTFERDDNSDYTCPSNQFWVYKALPYPVTATESFDNGMCSFSSSGSFSAPAPATWENKVCIVKSLESNGQHPYDIGIHASFVKPSGVMTTCNPGGSTTTDWKPFIAVAAGVPGPTVSDFAHLQRSVDAPFQPGRLWEWDLIGEY